jgi:hypothetical protein
MNFSGVDEWKSHREKASSDAAVETKCIACYGIATAEQTAQSDRVRSAVQPFD